MPHKQLRIVEKIKFLVSNSMSTKKQIVEFFSKTFWAFQFVDMDKLVLVIDKMLDLLGEWEFIQMQNKEDFTDADKINGNDEKIKATLMGKRVAELYIDPLTAYFFITCLRDASDKKTNEFSFLQMISHTLEIRPLLRVGVREQEKIHEELVKHNDFLLENEPSMYEPEYEDFFSSIKTALMMHESTSKISKYSKIVINCFMKSLASSGDVISGLVTISHNGSPLLL